MADISIALKSILSGISAVTGVYPASSIESKKLPLIMYRQINGEERDSLTGWLGDREDEFEVNVLCAHYDECRNTAAAVREAVKNAQHGINSGIYIQAVFLDDNSPELWENDARLYRKIVNVRFVYTETT